VKNSTRFVLIIILLTIGFWLQNLLETKPELITREKTRFANYFLEDFKLTAHDKDGKIKYVLSAKRLDNFEDEKIAEIQNIEAEFYNQESNWTITSAKANLFHNNNVIEFYDGVKINRPKQPKRPELILETDRITLLGDQDILQTDSKVSVKSGNTQFESMGLSFDNKQGILELKSKVKGTYVK